MQQMDSFNGHVFFGNLKLETRFSSCNVVSMGRIHVNVEAGSPQ